MAEFVQAATAPSMWLSDTVSVAVPSITDPDSAIVNVDVSGGSAFQPVVGDAVTVIPLAALPTNCVLSGAWVNATDQVQITFTSVGGSVTGAASNFRFLYTDCTH
jgi:hypothetical protein